MATPGNFQFSPGLIGTAGTSITLTAPTGIANGDLLHAAVAVDIPAGGDPGAISMANAGTGAAWVKISDHYTPARFHGSLRLAIFHKIASGESGNYTASWTTSGNAAWGIVDVPGISTTNPVDAFAINSDGSGSSPTIVAPAITGLSASSDFEICTYAGCGGANPYTSPAALTTIFNNGQPNTDWVFLCMAYQNLSSNANTTTQSLTSTGGDPWETSSVAYQTTGGGGGGGGGGSPSTGPSGYNSGGVLLNVLRERASGILEPVRDILRPLKPAFT